MRSGFAGELLLALSCAGFVQAGFAAQERLVGEAGTSAKAHPHGIASATGCEKSLSALASNLSGIHLAQPEKTVKSPQCNVGAEGLEKSRPSTMLYRAKRDKAYTMTLSATQACEDKEERSRCSRFVETISTIQPAFGTNMADSHIGGLTNPSIFLLHIDTVQYPGTDALFAYLAADSRPPLEQVLTLHIHAVKGNAMLQLSAPVTECPTPENTTADLEYFRRNCMDHRIVRRAREVADTLTRVFALAVDRSR